MPTLNQERVAQRVKEVVEKGEAVDGKDILAFVGYAPGMHANPKMVFESKGFKEAMKKLGFSVEAADMTMAKILRTGKEENKIRAGQEIYKRLGAYAQGETNKTLILIISGETANRYKLNEGNNTS